MKIPATLAHAMPMLSAMLAADSENSFMWGGTFSEMSANPFTYTAPPSSPAQKHSGSSDHEYLWQ